MSQSLEEKIDSFSELKENWDTYGAPAISPKAIEIAHRVVHCLGEGNWTVVPTINGGVLFEGLGMEIEVHRV